MHNCEWSMHSRLCYESSQAWQTRWSFFFFLVLRITILPFDLWLFNVFRYLTFAHTLFKFILHHQSLAAKKHKSFAHELDLFSAQTIDEWIVKNLLTFGPTAWEIGSTKINWNQFSRSRPRTGFDKGSLERLEQLFRKTVGSEKEIRREDFKKIVTSKNVRHLCIR